MEWKLSVARRTLLALTLISYVVVFSLCGLVGLNVDFISVLAPCLCFVAGLFLFNWYCRARGNRVLGAMMEISFCQLLLGVPVVVSTYLAMRLNKPLADDLLVSWDVMIGVDWRRFILFVDSKPLIAEALDFAYASFAFQLMGLPLILVVAGQVLRAYRMVIAYTSICFVASVVSIWFPALGTYAVYGVGIDDVTNIDAYFGYFFLEQFHAVRNDPDFVLSIQNAAGILTFPSVHAAIAALCAWAGWSVRLVRYPLVCLNILMAVSAVTHANHYVVDVLAGIGIAIATVTAVTWLTGRGWATEPVETALPSAA